jgi:predicted nucleic acid-binding protein
MPVLKYLADTNIVSDYFRPGNPVKEWFATHRGEIGISTLTFRVGRLPRSDLRF